VAGFFREQLGMKNRTFDQHHSKVFAILGLRTRSGATGIAILWGRGHAGEGGQA
jgi:DNA-binding CsgD family transcriptional regulator